MSGWFDKLLEELQRRQEEADARSEGRPCEPRDTRNVTPIDEEPAARQPRPATDDGGGPPVARPVSGGDTSRGGAGC